VTNWFWVLPNSAAFMPVRNSDGSAARERCDAAASLTIEAMRVSGNVGDQEPGLLFTDHDVVIEIPRHRGHGHIARGHLKVRGVGELGGQDGQLDATGHFEFVLNVAQALVPL
jgi:hypothetical protein